MLMGLPATHCLHRSNVMLLQLEPLHFNLKTTQQPQEAYVVLLQMFGYMCAAVFTDM